MKKIILLLLLATTAEAQRTETADDRLDRIELHLDKYYQRHKTGGYLVFFGASAAGMGYFVAQPKHRPYVCSVGGAFMLTGLIVSYLASEEIGKIKFKKHE
jgi:hypothetical protein